MFKIQNNTRKMMTSKALFGAALLLNSVVAIADCRVADLYQSAAPERFQVATSGTVIDNVTGLMWQTCLVGLSGEFCSNGKAKALSWDDGMAAASSDRTAGYSDWRLPNIKELASLIEYSCVSPALNTTLFPNPGRFLSEANQWEYTVWSSTPYYNNGAIRYIDFINGADNSRNRSSKELIRLVRDVDPRK